MTAPESAPFSLALAMEHGGRAMTRDGRLVTHLTKRSDGYWPIGGLLGQQTSVWSPHGRYYYGESPSPFDLRNLTPKEAEEQGVGQEVMGMSVKDARDVIRRAINETVPTRPEIDTSRPVDSGGPAFACAAENGHQPGMSRRDYFAGQALAGIMANPERWKQIADDYRSGKKTYEQCSMANAVKAYSIADAMLRASADGAGL